jgi:peptidoglycan/xylan/chitin deacetylase (PgdA/CDA1 family)
MNAKMKTRSGIALVCKAACVLIFSLLAGSCRFLLPQTERAPIICFTFDDQHSSIWQYAFPILDSYGYRGTNFVNAGRIGHPDLMTWDQLRCLELDHGWETGGHTLDHQFLPSLSYAEADSVIALDYYDLLAHGLDPKGFALPGGNCPAEYYPIITRHYGYIRGSSDFAMHRPLNLLGLGYLPYQSSWTANDVIARINRGIADGEDLIVIGFHRIETTTGGYSDNCPAEELTAIMDYVQAQNLRVLTLSEAVAEL